MAQLPLLNAQTGTTYTLVLLDAGKLVTLSNASAITLTVPPSSSIAYAIGTSINIVQTGAGQVTVVGGSGVTVNATPSLKLRTQNSAATLLKVAADTWQLVGNLESTSPAFSAYASGSVTLTNATFTKVLFATEEFDTNNNFASSTFTPTVAGYYQVSGIAAANPTGTAGVIMLASVYKNGSRFKDGTFSTINDAQGGWSGVSSLIYLNGSSDYIEMYCYIYGVASLTSQTTIPFFAAIKVA